MATVITMPKLGLTMTSGSVAKWHKKEGDRVEKGEVVLEVSTEKITYKVEAPESGVLRKILMQPGTKVPIGTPLCIIAAPDEDISELLKEAPSAPAAEKPAQAEAKPAPVAAKPAGEEVLIKATPIAKKIAKEHGIDLALVTGTGPGGRIVEKDVLDFIERQKAERAKPVVEAAQLKRIALSDVRQVIAERMSTSWQNSPMVTLNADVDCTLLKKLREDLKSSFKEKGLNLSYNYILMKACAVALKEQPMLNSYLEGNEVVLYDEINIGLAVATEEALLVPVVKDVAGKNLYEIASDGDALIEKARKGELAIDDVTGGTFTVTNLGMFGVRDFTPIINPPQCAILGVGEMKDRPCVCDGQIIVKPMMTLSLTFDHRIVDGAQGAMFIRRVKELLENPLLLLAVLK
ncbi:pyruvate dehydrogenase E2 component (dihydrolipoamide acetyltransferase) [Acetomicrobium thermoterrenum DSM 13490]|uniref:Dihydrolipoamide acetyltransferase component of pyruvate dehydrogenase complex n=1 Tax=Acetomicrobium thermoterrenum DSM 13490 TaxID=1120987 RepID=A0A1H3FJN1_9BACT|nr:dihydrolipoamide acetyltransferase family protein [Acetomicrobium thermoterrenum]SDX90354.1 pyruvate dehydrogenase E2 component (dihydrolipoamide acetyltransferase) [Acetomicrobium thermoterrenum DSM 13490]